MAQKLTMPKLGMTMESGRVVEWKKNEGDEVAQGEIVLLIETEKVQYEVESPAAGILHILAPPDTEAPPGTALALVASDRAEYAALTAAEPVPGGAPSAPEAKPQASAPGPGPEEKIRIAPAARRLAEQKGIDIRLLRGTGPGGRITREDVQRFERERMPAAGPENRVIVLPRTELRRIVARRMTESLREAAQTTASCDVDATALVEFRKKLLAQTPPPGIRVTITDILMKLTSCALQEHPIINSSYGEEADILYRDVHMGMALAPRENELLVPVIRHIDKKSLHEIAAARSDLVERGRSGKLSPDELRGSTFTISSLGMFGLQSFVAIIPRPENAILAVGAIVPRPWVHEGRIAIRDVMNLTLSYDHRTIYGAEAARFLATLRKLVEDPEKALTGI